MAANSSGSPAENLQGRFRAIGLYSMPGRWLLIPMHPPSPRFPPGPAAAADPGTPNAAWFLCDHEVRAWRRRRLWCGDWSYSLYELLPGSFTGDEYKKRSERMEYIQSPQLFAVIKTGPVRSGVRRLVAALRSPILPHTGGLPPGFAATPLLPSMVLRGPCSRAASRPVWRMTQAEQAATSRRTPGRPSGASFIGPRQNHAALSGHACCVAPGRPPRRAGEYACGPLPSRLAAVPVCAASLRIPARNAGPEPV